MKAIEHLLLALADDELFIGHRASEWTGLGPLLEADLALSSIAQDEMGHALLLYNLLHTEFGQPDPDAFVYMRRLEEFRNAIFCELPRGDWGETLVRHFLYDLAEQIRWAALKSSSYPPLAAVAQKILPEERYHMIHGQSYMQRLAHGTKGSHARLQAALDKLIPYALGLWEPVSHEEELVSQGVTPASEVLRDQWWTAVTNALGTTFTLPELESISPITGGRQGHYTEGRVQIVGAMQLLHSEIPGAAW